MGVQRLHELGLHLDVANFTRTITRFQIFDLGRVGVEGVLIHEDGVAFHRARDVRADSLRIGVHLHHFFSHRFGVVR